MKIDELKLTNEELRHLLATDDSFELGMGEQVSDAATAKALWAIVDALCRRETRIGVPDDEYWRGYEVCKITIKEMLLGLLDAAGIARPDGVLSPSKRASAK